MIKLYETGAYYADGKLIPDDGHAAEALAAMGRAVPKEEARKRTIAYSILEAHNTSGNMDDLKIKFDAMASHDITYVGIVQTARASGLEKFPLPYVLTNCHNSLCAVGGTINEDDHMFGLSAAKKYGGIYVPAHQAVIHQYMREMMSGCGKMILGSDSHTPTGGGIGMLAIGAGCEAFNNKQLRNVEEFLKQHNCNLRFTAGYGSSEAGSNATLPMAPFPVRDGNVGVPMIHSVISIFKPGTQEELTYNTPGEICMTGPGVMLGYDRPEATAKALQVHADGKTWLHTGDIGYMSEDGVLYTMTRGASPRFGGGDLMVQPLENIVADADIKGIKDEFFVIVPDDEHEGCFLPYLYVQLKDGYTLDDVRDKINACLPERYMRPVEIFTVPERPFFHFKTNRIGLSKEIIAKRNQQKEKAKRNSFADGCIA